MKKALQWLTWIFFACALTVVALVLALYQLVRVGDFRRFVIAELEKRTDLKLDIGAAHLQIGAVLGIAFEEVALSDTGAGPPIITASRVTTRLALLPLLERKLVVYEIRLHDPIGHLTIDERGRIPALERIVALRFLGGEDAPFTLDVQSVRLSGGRMDLDWRGGSRDQTTLRLRDASIERTQVIPPALREQQALREEASGQPAGLSFQLAAAVEKDGAVGQLNARGMFALPSDALDLRDAWWDADLRLVDIPPAVMREAAPFDPGGTSVSGHLTQRLRIAGSLSRRISIAGKLEFRRLAFEAPGLSAQSVALGDGRADFTTVWTPPGRLEVTRFVFSSDKMRLSLQGEMRDLDKPDSFVHFDVTNASLPVTLWREMVASKFASQDYSRWAGLFSEGDLQLARAGVRGRLSELRQMAAERIGERMWLDGQIRNASARLPWPSASPLSDIRARITLARGVFAVTNLRARYGRSRISNLDATFTDGKDASDAVVRAEAELDLSEVWQHSGDGVLPARLAGVADSLRDVSGSAKIVLAAHRSSGPLEVEGTAALEHGRARFGDLLLTDIHGDVRISPTEIAAEKLRAAVFQSPVQIQVGVRNYAADNAAFDLRVESPGVRAGIVTRLLLGTGSLQDEGLVKGAIRYRGPLAAAEARKLTGALEFANVRLAVAPLLQPLEQLNGKVIIGEDAIQFQAVRGLLAGFPANFAGRWRFRERPQLLFEFTAPQLDITSVVAQIDPEGAEFYDDLQALGKLAVGSGRVKAFEFSDFNSDVMIDKRVWRFINPTLRAAGGVVTGPVTMVDKGDTVSLSLKPTVRAVPVESFLGWFGLSTSEMSGKVNLTGTLETSGASDAQRKRNLGGNFSLRIEDGTIYRLRIVIQILNLLDLSRWFTLQVPDLTKQGIRFRSVTGDFKIVDGVYVTENLIVDSDDLRMTGQGRIDVPNDEIDFVVAVRPFAGIDSVIGHIPLIGRGISAIKNSFLVGSFNVRGPIDDPTITPAPLSTISEVFLGILGIPQNVIGRPERKHAAEPPAAGRGGSREYPRGQ